MDISSKGSYPSNALSNFAAHRFTFDGVQCNSMEGLLQSFKFEKREIQEFVCTLVGAGAKRRGASRTKAWQRVQTLWWNGVAYPRKSKEYQALLTRAYDALYAESEGFRRALEASGDAVYRHSFGRSNESETVLTTAEFCGQLTRLRDRLRAE
jgi:hypothetical protein